MAKRGPKPKGKVALKWSPNFAYAMGLLVTDGNVSSDMRHVSLVSKDLEQLHNFCKSLSIEVPISFSVSGFNKTKISRVQFGDSLFCEFLVSVGITPNKTKTINKVSIPRKYIFDFLRGHLDGDGCVNSYWDPRWKSSFMFYTTFVSASHLHILWLQEEIHRALNIRGHISTSKTSIVSQLRYAKADSIKLWKELYYPGALSLTRKRLKIEAILRIIVEQEKNS